MPYIKCVTPDQQNALDELKIRVKNELTSPALLEDDGLFYKFLKARSFNVDKAEKMLRKHIVWRKVNKVDNILETFKPKEVFVKILEPSFIGFDKDGDVVTFIASGRVNNTEMAKCMKLNDVMKHWIWFAEKQTSISKQQISKTGIKAPVTLIIDLDKLELSNTISKETTAVFLRISRLIRDNYAERLKSAYIINAPAYYVFVYVVIKTVLTSVLLKRIHFYGHSGWKEKLLEAIDADVLPVFLGGKRTDPDGDPYCRSFITIPGKISESYHLSDEERYFKNTDNVSQLTIPPTERKKISILVKKVGSLIRWKFMVMSKTISVGLFFQESENKLKEIIPLYEYETLDGTEENFYQCTFEGTYIIIFDNSHSRFSGKEVKYTVLVEEPKM